MPFELKISRVTNASGLPRVSGHLVSGDYYGPGAVEVPLEDGSVFATSIGSMGGDSPKGWPMLPEHESVLHLDLQERPPVSIRVGAILRGIGIADDSPKGRVCRSDFLTLPIFWAVHYWLLIGDGEEDEGELCRQLLRFYPGEMDEFYVKHFITNSGAKPWPYFRKDVSNGCFIEVEYAEAEEYQVRYKLGDASRMATLGYDSGHFSLPSLRWSELRRVANCLQGKERATVMLLMFPGIYVSGPELLEAQAALLCAFADLGLFQQGDPRKLVRNIVGNRTSDSRWSQHPELGWVCDGMYAQRNPESKLSKLTPADFKWIADWFAALPEGPETA